MQLAGSSSVLCYLMQRALQGGKYQASIVLKGGVLQEKKNISGRLICQMKGVVCLNYKEKVFST